MNLTPGSLIHRRDYVEPYARRMNQLLEEKFCCSGAAQAAANALRQRQRTTCLQCGRGCGAWAWKAEIRHHGRRTTCAGRRRKRAKSSRMTINKASHRVERRYDA